MSENVSAAHLIVEKTTVMKVLLIEDSRFYGALVRDRLTLDARAEVTWTTSLAETQTALAAAGEPFLVAIVDLNLPDAPNGEAVDAVAAAGVRPIILSGDVSDSTRDALWAKQVVDYVIKEGPQAIDYVVDLVRRLSKNPQVKVLVVDDSAVARAQTSNLLKLHRYQVFEANSGQAALEVLLEHPDIVLMLTDYYMPEMDGYELVRQVRKTHPRDRLAIVGISSYGTGYVTARFLKSGANDFLYKPALAEEFYCRIAENVRALEHIWSLEDLATRDALTNLHNRRYFFSMGEKLCANARRGNLTVGVGMIDIDHFKRVNDTYGHQTGDEVLRQVSAVIAGRARESDVLARMGGEEFAILTANMSPEHGERVFNEVREKIEALEIRFNGHIVRTTASIGVCLGPPMNLDDLLAQADKMLYVAKAAGRNRVVYAAEGRTFTVV
jgi:diguanylate cyclase (GGDEF)-like protein